MENPTNGQTNGQNGANSLNGGEKIANGGAATPHMNQAAQDLVMMRALSTLLDRKGWMSQAGLTFEGNRDLWNVFGYKKDITPLDMYIKYKRQDIARSIVHAPADALWTRPPKITGSESFQTAWNALSRHVQVWDALNRADRMTGWGRYSIIVMGLPGRLSAPARKRNSLEDLLYLQPYSELGLEIERFDMDPASPRFRKPEIYKIKTGEADIDPVNRTIMNTPGAGQTIIGGTLRVHWTRVIHIADGLLEDDVYGTPRLECAYNLLDDLLKVAGGSAETYWLTANRGVQMDIDKEMTLNTADAAALSDEVEEYYHNLRRFIRTRGVNIKELGNKVADPSTTLQGIFALIAAATRIPQRILIGSEAGQLASEQDRANWAERVSERRANFAQPHALSPTVNAFQRVGLLPEDPTVTFEWPEAFILAPLERSQTSAQKARSAANLSKVQVDTPSMLTIEESRAIIGFGDVEELVQGTVNNPGAVPTSNANAHTRTHNHKPKRKR